MSVLLHMCIFVGRMRARVSACVCVHVCVCARVCMCILFVYDLVWARKKLSISTTRFPLSKFTSCRVFTYIFMYLLLFVKGRQLNFLFED